MAIKKVDETPIDVEVVDPTPAANVPAVPAAGPQYYPPEELPTPRVNIIQKPSDEHPNAGVFANNLTGEETAELRCVILGMRRGRILWPKVGEGDEPLCRSRNFAVGEGVPGGDCTTCPKKDWVADAKPECAETIDFAALDDQGVPFFLQVSRSGLKPARAFVASAQYRAKPLYYTAAIITLKKETKPGLHYVPVFKRGVEIDPATWPEFEEVLKRLSAAWDRVQEPAKEQAAAEY